MLKGKIDVKKIQDNVVDQSRNVWFAGLGVYATVSDESTKLYNKVVDTSKDFVAKGKKIEKAKKKSNGQGVFSLDKTRNMFQDKIKNVRDIIIEPLGVSSHNEVQELNEKVDKLTEIVVVLAQKMDNKKLALKAA